MVNLTMGHGVSECFGTRLAPEKVDTEIGDDTTAAILTEHPSVPTLVLWPGTQHFWQDRRSS